MDIVDALEIEAACRSHTFRQKSLRALVEGLLTVIDDLRSEKTDPPVDDGERVVELYQQHLPMCRGVEALTPQRMRSMIARWREFQKGKPREKRQGFVEFWEAVFKHAAKSDFLTGRRPNDRGWRPNIDFFLQRSSLLKLREGAYHSDDKTHAVGSVMAWI